MKPHGASPEADTAGTHRKLRRKAELFGGEGGEVARIREGRREMQPQLRMASGTKENT